MKQTAQDVWAALPTAESRPTVTVDPSGENDVLGRPAQDSDVASSSNDVPLDPIPKP